MSVERLTKLEILNETISFYGEDPKRRAINFHEEDGNTCLYNTNDGRHCAVGRCFTDEIKALGESFKENKMTSADNLNDLESLLQDKYKGHEVRFWHELQKLHDECSYWGDKGLSIVGEVRVNSIKEQFGITE